MMTLRQYAENRGVSYEAVRQLVNRHAETLEGHIHKQGRTRLLDDTAVQIMDDLRQNQRIIVQRVDPHEEVEALKAENKALLIKLDQLHDELHQEQRKNEQLHIQLQEALKKALEVSGKVISSPAAEDDAIAQESELETSKVGESVDDISETGDDQEGTTPQRATLWQRIKFVFRGEF